MVFFEIAQFVKFFIISPITWMVAALILGFTLKSKIWRKSMLILSALLFVVFTNGWIYERAKHSLYADFSTSTVNPDKEYQVAIVMGGYGFINTDTGQMGYSNENADRLWEAIRLYKEGKVKKILISGDPTIVKDRYTGESSAQKFLNYMESIGIPQDAFILEQYALNSYENAKFSVEIINKMGLKDSDCVLVTSALHMRRSLQSFNKFGFHPVYHPTGIENMSTDFSHRMLYPRWSVAVDWEALFNEIIGEIVYKFK